MARCTHGASSPQLASRAHLARAITDWRLFSDRARAALCVGADRGRRIGGWAPVVAPVARSVAWKSSLRVETLQLETRVVVVQAST